MASVVALMMRVAAAPSERTARKSTPADFRDLGRFSDRLIVSFAVCALISPPGVQSKRMKTSDEELREARSFLRAKLAEPRANVDQWLNSIVDQWIAARKSKSKQVRHV